VTVLDHGVVAASCKWQFKLCNTWINITNSCLYDVLWRTAGFCPPSYDVAAEIH